MYKEHFYLNCYFSRVLYSGCCNVYCNSKIHLVKETIRPLYSVYFPMVLNTLMILTIIHQNIKSLMNSFHGITNTIAISYFFGSIIVRSHFRLTACSKQFKVLHMAHNECVMCESPMLYA